MLAHQADTTSSQSQVSSSKSLIVRSVSFSLGFLKSWKVLILGFLRPSVETATERGDKGAHQSRWDHLGKVAHGDEKRVGNSCLHQPRTTSSFQRGFLWAQLEDSQKIQCGANADSWMNEPRFSQLGEASGSSSLGLRQLFSVGREEAKGYLKPGLEPVLAT